MEEEGEEVRRFGPENGSYEDHDLAVSSLSAWNRNAESREEFEKFMGPGVIPRTNKARDGLTVLHSHDCIGSLTFRH